MLQRGGVVTVHDSKCMVGAGLRGEYLGGTGVSALYSVCDYLLDVVFRTAEGSEFLARAVCVREQIAQSVKTQRVLVTLTKYSTHSHCCKWREVLPFCICGGTASAASALVSAWHMRKTTAGSAEAHFGLGRVWEAG